MDANDYLKELEFLKKPKSNTSKNLEIYRKVKRTENININLDNPDFSLRKKGPYKDEEIYTGAMARESMKRGVKKKDLMAFFTGALMYQKLGKEYSAIPKIIRGLKEMKQNGAYIDSKVYNFAEEYIKRNSKKPEKSGNLEKNLGIVGSVLGFGGAIFFLSLKLTGNAIGSMSANSFNFLGFIFLAIGITAAALLMIKN